MGTQESILDPGGLGDLVGRAVEAVDALGLGERRLAVMGGNSAGAIVAHLAALAAGVSSVPIARYLGAAEVAYILADSGAGAILCSEDCADVAAEAAAQTGVPLCFLHDWPSPDGAAADGTVGDRAAADGAGCAGGPAPPADWWRGVAPEGGGRPARTLLVYTSGTTGRPKGTEMRWLRRVPPTVGEHLAALADSSPFPPGPHLVAGPLHHTGPLSAVRHALAGGTVVVLDRFDAEAVLAAVERHRVESSVMVPTHFSRLLALPEDRRAGADVSSLRRVIHTGAACPVDVKRAIIEWWGPVLFEAYGGSESGTVCAIDSEEWLARPGSVGRAVAGFEALVLDEAGRPLPPGAEGALWFRDLSGRGVRYHGVASEAPEPGLFTLGEIGRVDADGYVWITDRHSDMVVSGGVNLYPAEAEAVLAQHPAVADVAVIGVPDADMGEALRALVVAAPAAGAPPDAAELDAFCRARLAAPKCPRSYELVDGLGRNAMGKLDKRALRRPYWPTDRTIGG